MPVRGQRIATAAGFDQDVRPPKTCLDMDGRHLADADADLVLAEPRAFVADDGAVRHLDDRGKKMVSQGPPAGLKFFRFHAGTVTRNPFFANPPAKAACYQTK